MKIEPTCPVVSFKSYLDGNADQESIEQVTQEVTNALDNFGAFFITDHNIDRKLCDKMLKEFKQFFDLPVEEKRLLKLSNKSYRGYEFFESSNANAFMNKFGFPNDSVERLRFGPPEMYFKNYFDIEPSKAVDEDFMLGWAPNLYHNCFKETFQVFYKGMADVAFKVMEVLSMAMGQPADYLPKLCAKAAHVGNAAHYPGVAQKSRDHNRMAAHTDLSVVTVIMQDNTKNALKCQTVDGEWVCVNSPEPFSILVLLGACMPFLTNGHWQGTLHSVAFPDDPTVQVKDRLSTQFFALLPESMVMKPAPKFLKEDEEPSVELLTYKELSKRRMKYLITE